MASSIDLTALTANLGGYYRENRDILFTQMLLDLDGSLANAGIVVMDDVVDEVPLPNLSVENFLRPGDGATNDNKATFSPTVDAIKFDSRTLKAYPVMGDLLIQPWKFERSWLAHNRRGKASFKEWQDIPFYEWIAAEIVKKAKEQIRKATWQGVRNTAGTSFLDICDGVLQVRADGITAGLIPTVATGAITANNVVAAIESVARGLGDGYSEADGFLPVSRTIYDWYVTADETQFGRSIQLNELVGQAARNQPQVYVRGTNIKLVKEPGLGSSQVLTVYTEGNLHAGTDTLNQLNNMDFEKFERSIKVMIDLKWGVNFGMLHATAKPVVTNDVDLPE